MTINPIIFFGNAYDCYPAIEALEDIEDDQVHINYVKYPHNYTIIEKFLEKHPEYTHIFYVAPDLLLDEHQWKCMKKYVEDNDPLVYGACCNVDDDNHKDSLACTLKLPSVEYNQRIYRWVKETHRNIFLQAGAYVIDVKFNANLAFVRRDVKDKIPYMALPYPTDERPIHESRGGYACDLAFCHYMDYLGIIPKVDMRYKLVHLRYCGKLQVGLKPPSIVFKSKGNEYDITKDFISILE